MIRSWFLNSTRKHARDESGASLIEYTVVIILFLLVFFAILDFGRLGFNWVMTEKAMQRAARIAVTREPVCAGVPEIHTREGASTEAFGTLCRVGGVCVNGGVQQCTLAAADVGCGDDINANTATEIWCILEPILPSNAIPQNIEVSYTYDQNLGFVGGPYTPMVEVGTVTTGANELRFEFITPIPALIAIASGAAASNLEDDDSNSLADIPFPALSVSMPGEDLNQGNNG